MPKLVDEIDVLPPKGVRPPVLGPGHDLGTATDRIAGIVLAKHTPVFWFAIVAVAVAIFGMFNTAVAYLLGLRHRQFRVVDWYRPCWNPDFRHSSAVQTELAHLHQPLC